MNLIKEGFYSPSLDFDYHCDQPPEEIIREVMLEIRAGGRPSLHLYRNLNPKSDVQFMCPDDVAACLAYRRLGFGAVPAVVLGPGQDPLPFASFETRSDPKYSHRGPSIRGIVGTAKPKTVRTIAGLVLPTRPGDLLNELQRELSRLVVALRAFHSPSRSGLHYHHMVFSALVRMQETLRAIHLLLEQNLWYQALSLLRVVYEIHLNFCFDWIQPETTYRYLAAAAVFNGREISRRREEMKSELEEDGLPTEVAMEKAATAWKPVAIASNVAEKAKFSNIGVIYHKEIYEFLSQVTHQDFEVASLHANRFNDENFLVIDESIKKTYLRFTDLIVTEFATRITDDIGNNEGNYASTASLNQT